VSVSTALVCVTYIMTLSVMHHSLSQSSTLFDIAGQSERRDKFIKATDALARKINVSLFLMLLMHLGLTIYQAGKGF
jgi:hypothetical protein